MGSVEQAHAGHLETMLAYVDRRAPDPRETFHEWAAELPPAERAAFAALAGSDEIHLVAKYHTESGRKHRLIVAVHPALDSRGED